MAGIRSGGCAALACAVLGIAGCKSFPTQEFNKDANGGVRSIAVAPIGLPDAPNIVILNAVGNSFGLIGGLVEATRASNASKEATAELAAAGLNYKTYVPAQIESALRDAGFEVVMLPGSRPAADGNKFLDALPATPGADALLDI